MSLSHAAKAEALIADEMQGGSFDQTRDYIAIAQVHATLALVEQHRIANLIALADGGLALEEELSLLSDEAASALIHSELTPATPFSGPDEHFEFRPEIKKALGLS